MGNPDNNIHVKAMCGVVSAAISWMGDHFDAWVRALTFYGGAVLLVFSLVSVAMEIMIKWPAWKAWWLSRPRSARRIGRRDKDS
jgi:hypothetical protein